MAGQFFRGFVVLGSVALGVMAVGCSPSEEVKKDPDGTLGIETSCSNGVDDNGDEKVDCADPTCQGNSSCPVETRTSCVSQDECVEGTGAISYRYTYADPLRQCVDSFCVKPDKVRLYFSVNTARISGSGPMGSLNTRFVLKKDLQGNAVTCDTLRGVSDAQENNGAAAWSGAIESSKRFNVLAFDVIKLASMQAGNLVINPLLTSGVGKDFIIWTEVWYGDVDQATKLPTGNRMAFGCYETGPAVAEIKLSDNAPGDGSVGRKIEVNL